MNLNITTDHSLPLSWSVCLADLGSQVVFEHSKRIDSKFGNQWLFCVQQQARVCRQTWGFVKQVHVVQRKLLLHWLGHFDWGWVLSVAVVARKFHKPFAGLALNFELHAIRSSFDGEWFRKSLKFLADLRELSRVDGDEWAVLSIWDWEVLDIELDQVQVEFSWPLSLGVLEHKFQGWGVVISL